ncbi:hypothetical protein [Celerinatantimonas sp. MCCC 1A17872]|uniref:hypothetical protein n=1 Tax=Celerinatantimonas sp. MCCC 1A17872 TaxID=3177514 RepID=UPI0038CB4CB0
MSKHKGAVLILVLWFLALVSVLLMKLTASVATAQKQAQWQHDAARSAYLLNQGIVQSVRQLSSKKKKAELLRLAKPLRISQKGALVQVTVKSVRELVDLNEAERSVLAQLAQKCVIANASDWVNKAVSARNVRPFRSVSEIAAIAPLSMRSSRCVSNQATVWSGLSRPVSHRQSLHTGGGDIFKLVLNDDFVDGYHQQLQVTVVTHADKGQGKPYRILDWQEFE